MENQQVISATGAEQATDKRVLYTAKVHITGGREGTAKSDDGRLDILLTSPGAKGPGTNRSNCLRQAGRHVSSAPLNTMQPNFRSLFRPRPLFMQK